MAVISLARILGASRECRLDVLLDADDPDLVLLALGDESERLAFAEPGRAVEATAIVVELSDIAGGPRVRARSRRAEAQALAYTGRFEDALERCEEAIRIASSSGERVEAARSRLATLHSLAHLGRFEEALAAGEAARAAFLDSGEPALAGRADLNLGAVHAMRDTPRDALRHLDRARETLAGDLLLLAQVESNRGNALSSLNDFRAAEEAFRRAAAGFEEGNHPTAAAIAEGNLAYLAARQGLLQPALRHFERARRLLAGDQAQSHHTRLLAEQADALLALGMPAEAVEVFQQVLPELEQLGMVVEAAQSRAGLGRALQRLDRLDEATAALCAASEALAGLGQVAARARVDLARTEIDVARGERRSARGLATRALNDLSDRPADAAGAHVVLAGLALEEGDLDVAEGELAAAFAPAERLGLSPVLATLHLLRARLNRRRCRRDASLADYRASIAEVERIRGTLQAERFRSAFLGTRLIAYEEAVSLALESPTVGGIAEAFATAERCKSRALLDLLGDEAQPVQPKETLSESEVALQQHVATLRAELNWHYSRQAESAPGDRGGEGAAIDAIAAKESELARLEDRMAMISGPGDVLAPTTLANVQETLPTTTALLAYFIAGQETLVFLVRAESAHVVRKLTSVAELEHRLRRLRFQIGRGLATPEAKGSRWDRLLADTQRELGDLDTVLLAPVRPHLSGIERLIVVPHGPLHALPFHALWDGEQHLLDTFDVSYAPSASVSSRLASRPLSGTEQPPLVVGVADELAPGIPGEVIRVAQALGPVNVLEGAEASVDRVVTASAGAPLLHLACHGRFSTAHPASSGLKLGDRWLTPGEIAALHLRDAHVSLSACDTGRAYVSSGDELLGLSRAFYAAGAASLLMSLWPVHDETAIDLMTDFYRHWRAGQTKVHALRLAQIACRQRRPHPALWAPFIVGGDA